MKIKSSLLCNFPRKYFNKIVFDIFIKSKLARFMAVDSNTSVFNL